MHITHWVPTSGKRPSWPVVDSWMNTIYPGEHSYVRSIPGNIEFIWNKATKDFLESDSDWLWSTHEDVQYKPNTLERLMSWDKPLVTALSFMRHSPVVPFVWRAYEGHGDYYAYRIRDTRAWFTKHHEYITFEPFVMDPCPDDALTEVTFTSTNCTLIRRDVIEGIYDFVGPKWWVLDHEERGGGEDRRFFELAKEAGFVGYVDRSIGTGHIIGDVATTSADFMAWDSISQFDDTGEPPEEVLIAEGEPKL